MKPTKMITSRAIPLDRSDVDTDQIIPASWLKRVERTGFGEGLFSEWRKDPDFVLNQPEIVGAEILIAGPNFGTGSSREHAVWALEDFGIRAVVSPQFGDIFRNNCTKVGVVPAQIDPEAARTLLDAVLADPQLLLTVDVATLEVRVASVNFVATFELDAHTQQRFLSGLDDIGLTMNHESAIAAFEEKRTAAYPWMIGSKKPV